MPPRKFLVIQTAFIGDVVLATALVENLHQAFPDSAIDMMVRKGNESLLRDHPLIRKVYVWQKQQKKFRNLLRLVREIRRERYERVINVQRYAATGFLTSFSGARETIGFDKNPLSFLFTIKVKHWFSGLHEIERNHQLISHFVKAAPLRPRLYPSETDNHFISRYLNRPFITISPASVWFTKQYPAQRWAEFLNSLPSKYTIYVLGGPDDRSLGEAITQMTTSKAPVNLCGELSFLQSAALMRHANMNYVNDSAPLHFASAVNAPVTAIYCSTIPGFGYGPLSDKKFIVEKQEPLYCRPCGIHGYSSCPQEHFKCAMDIRTSQLLASLQEEE
jgi:lipopolysaccharide heptosyltransferase II